MGKENDIQWHLGFCAAMELELREYAVKGHKGLKEMLGRKGLEVYKEQLAHKGRRATKEIQVKLLE